MNNSRIGFWGTSRFSVFILEEMKQGGVLPTLIITMPAKPKGRGLLLAPSEVKVWADRHGIKTIEPTEIKSDEFLEILGPNWELFIIASYGKIIPRRILDLPARGTLNVHPSLLPKFRGTSPLQSAILEDVPIGSTNETGVTIMQIDEEVDHGPIVAQEKVLVENWPPKESELEEMLGRMGGKLLTKTMPLWLEGKINPHEQDHSLATYTKKVTKDDACINLENDPGKSLRKIRAFNVWPRAYFVTRHNNRDIRVIVTDAKIVEGKLIPLRVIPESKNEMSYDEFLRGQK